MRIVLVTPADADEPHVLARLRTDGVGFSLRTVVDRGGLAAALREGCDVVLGDHRHPSFDARGPLELLRHQAPSVPYVVVLPSTGDDSTPELLRLGAAACLFEDRLAGLIPTLENVVKQVRGRGSQRLLDSQASALLDTSFAGFFRSLPDGRILHANGALHRMFGYDRLEDFLQVNAATLYAQPEQRHRIMAAARAGEDLHESEVQMHRRDGGTLWASLTVRTVRERGQLVELTGVIIDVTERREASARLRRRIERQEALLEFSQVAVGITTSNRLFEAAVRSAARMLATPLAAAAELDVERRALSLRATHGFFWDGNSAAPDVAPAWLTEGQRGPAVLEDSLALELPLPDLLERHGVRSLVSAPVVAGDRRLGVLSVHDTVPRHWELDDIESLQIAADMLGLALERRREAKERQSLFAQLAHAQEQERRVVAGEIHDDAVQVMAATNIRLELLRRQLVDPQQVLAARSLQETIEASIGRLRSLLFNLTPPDMESYGLAAAVRAQLEQLGLDEDVRWTLEEGELGPEPDEAVRIMLFRICQEALVNTRKHAGAGKVTVRLFHDQAGYGASIQDDGRGFDPAVVTRQPGHLGLASMRERATSAGGWWKVTSSPGSGTLVETWLPERGAA